MSSPPYQTTAHFKEEETPMFLRIDRLQAELLKPTKADPNAPVVLQELLGGKFGEMFTLNNYFFQSFNFRDEGKLKPFYSLVASITAEELGWSARCFVPVNKLV
jgi:Mn-containing catalase